MEIAEDPNELGAKLIKAELMGDDDLAESLRIRLERAREIAESRKSEQQKQPSNNQRGNFKTQHKPRHEQRQDLNQSESKILKRNYKYDGVEDEYDELAFSSHNETHSKKSQKKNFKSQSDKEINFEDKLNQKEENKTIENCQYCFENSQKHLVVSVGKYAYLSLPSTESFVEGNCLIIPINHCSSCVSCDEEVWNEIVDFKRALVSMFEKKRLDCVFLELYSTEKKHSHLIIECIPIGMNCSNLGPIYFKKAILESESEWATNKGLIDLKEKQLRNAIPKNMAYFSVGFGLDEGYAHVIENSEAYPDNFGKEVIAGILDLDPLVWLRPRKDDFNHQSKKVIEFLKWWKPFDFNKK